MIPAARIQAAIEILDHWLTGDVALEQALTGWARRSRFAGSKDRAAVRDFAFDAARRLRSDAIIGGAHSGRGLMIGALRRQGVDPTTIFGAGGHAPDALSEDEMSAGGEPAVGAEALDVPDWFWPLWQQSLGAQADNTARAWQDRAPVHLRVNLARISRDEARAELIADGAICHDHPACVSALEVTDGLRKIRQSSLYLTGLVELQDAGSQQVVADLGRLDGHSVLDYCAGGGGKTLALAMLNPARLYAHDDSASRMRDLPERAKRAEVLVKILEGPSVTDAAPFDVVLCDVPCSGSGSWRRAPDGKWRLTQEKLDQLLETQSEILDAAAQIVAQNGRLVYVTCSLLECENSDQVAKFLARHSGWVEEMTQSLGHSDGTDGFFSSVLRRAT
jgi:16S rRNA (cytosine967-C5)-methyltransferase